MREMGDKDLDQPYQARTRPRTTAVHCGGLISFVY